MNKYGGFSAFVYQATSRNCPHGRGLQRGSWKTEIMIGTFYRHNLLNVGRKGEMVLVKKLTGLKGGGKSGKEGKQMSERRSEVLQMTKVHSSLLETERPDSIYINSFQHSTMRSSTGSNQRQS